MFRLRNKQIKIIFNNEPILLVDSGIMNYM